MGEIKKGINELLKLVGQRPDLPVVAAVNYDVVLDDSYVYWMGHINGAMIDKVCTDKDGATVFYEDHDIEDALASVLSDDEYELLPDDGEGREKAFEALPWKEVIVAFVESGY